MYPPKNVIHKDFLFTENQQSLRIKRLGLELS